MRVPVLVLVALAVLTGCDRDAAERSGPTCADAVHTAAMAVEVDEQLRLLDAALLRCTSYEAYHEELTANPGVVGYSPETYIQLRCAHLTETRLRNSPTCRTAVPPTTPPPVSTPPLLYAAATLDGRIIELVPSDAVPFTGDWPVVVQETVDLAIAQGCPGVLAQRDRWAAQVGGPPSTDGALSAGDIASVYAQHAINVALWIGCEGAALDAGGPPTTT